MKNFVIFLFLAQKKTCPTVHSIKWPNSKQRAGLILKLEYSKSTTERNYCNSGTGVFFLLFKFNITDFSK